MPRTSSPFTTIRSGGALLPPEVLTRIIDADRDLGGLSPTDYHLGESERLGEAISRSWNRLVGVWASFAPSLDGFNANDPGTGATRERWLAPLFQELGFGRLQVAKAREIGGVDYPISHEWDQVPVHLVGAGVELDRRTKGVAGAAKMSPHALVQDYLNRTPNLWGIVSNGRELRVLRDNVSLTRQAYLAFDLEAMFSGEVYPDFALLWLVCHESRFEWQENKAEGCWLERWTQAAQAQGTRALNTLREGVERAIATLGAGFLAHPSNAALRDALSSGELTTADYYRELLRLIYRLIFLFVAEDRVLLHPEGTPEDARTRYHDYYSTTRLRRIAERLRGGLHPDLWRSLVFFCSRLADDDGCPELGLPFLGSSLFSPEACPHLDQADLANRDLLEAIRALAFTEQRRVLRQIDYRNMGSEELGSIYESLLELHPEVHHESGTFELATAAGNERKTTGSYYTPTSLISALLDTALDPVLDEAAARPDPEAAVLDLKVLDPACGSGHFLVAAAHRIAKRLAAIRTDEPEPSPDAYRAALRDAISHCVYGIDVNPMAVELCKVSLWMEAVEPGKPLSFLENHILCGNSLLGTTPRLLENGIPDEAFTRLEGDDRAVASELKRRNRQERKGQEVLALAPSVADLVRPLAQAVEALEHLPVDSPHDLHEKEALWWKIQTSTEAERARFLADAWCAAFVIRKTKGAPILTEGVLRLLQADTTGGDPNLHTEVRALAERYRLMHPHLAFPGVFQLPTNGEEPEQSEKGWSGGFDVVIGNPPWLSYSGRQRVDIEPHELGLIAYLCPDISSWPSSHSAFMLRSLALLGVRGACGLVAPLQVLHLERYGPLRTRIAREASATVEDVGEDAFEGVSQRVGLFCFKRLQEVDTQPEWRLRGLAQQANGTDPLSLTDSVSDSLTAELAAALRDSHRFPSAAFADPGVHTGNVSKLIVSDSFPPGDPDYAPVREGRDIVAYFCGESRKRLWIHPTLAADQYCTIRPREVYDATRILLRQTADRPIACRHEDPTFFRNSLLACRGVPGSPDEVVVAVLNSDLIRRWYQGEVQESGQRAFPQVKVRNLRRLPLFPIERLSTEWGDSTIGQGLIELVHDAEAQLRLGALGPAVLIDIEMLVCALYGLPDDLTSQLVEALATATAAGRVPA